MASSALPHLSWVNIMTEVICCLTFAPPIDMICQERPYLSCSQPYRSLNGYLSSSIRTFPPSANFPHNTSTSSFVLHETLNDIDGLNLKSGPALIAVNS